MVDFASWLDLPLVWGLLIATAVFLYVLLDGFDLGCGILFPFAPSNQCRKTILNSIAPFWDGNETWLVLGGGGLFAAFPVAYAILMPALYMPITLMLVGLIFRGVAFEFHFKSTGNDRKLWDIAFHGGSLLGAFMQGIILGNFVQGVTVVDRHFAGGSLDWANGFAITTGIALVFGYALLGATWLIMKTDGQTRKWARKSAAYVVIFVLLFMAIITISMPFIEERIMSVWFVLPNFLYLLPIPLLSIVCVVLLLTSLAKRRVKRPFMYSIGLFFLGYIGLGISMYPWIVPYSFTIWDAAAASPSQSLLLIGAVIFLPIILAYTAYSYYIFRGKSHHESMY